MSDFFNLKDWELVEEIINSLSFMLNTVNAFFVNCYMLDGL